MGVRHYLMSGVTPLSPIKNSNFVKIDASSFVELVKRRVWCFYLQFARFLTIFRTFSTFRPKSSCSDVKKSVYLPNSKISYQSPSNFHQTYPIDVPEGMSKTVAQSAAALELFRILDRGGRASFSSPPQSLAG